MSYDTAASHSSLQRIMSAASPEMLRSVRMQMQDGLLDQFASLHIEKWNQKVGEMHDAVMKQAAVLCEQQLVEEGFGSPPADYAFVVFGSAGRREQTLGSDQDNGLILADHDLENEEVHHYFELFGKRLSAILEMAGYPPCPGNVMVTNPLWRKTSLEWSRQLASWRDEPGWEQVRYLMIAADLRHISGNPDLTAGVRNGMYVLFEQESARQESFPAAVLRNTLRHKAALNVLGQVITEQAGEHAGEFDVKYGLYLPIVNAVRYLAVEYGIHASSTIDRLSQLNQLDAVPFRWVESCQTAFDTALRLRSVTAVKAGEREQSGSGYLPQSLLKQKEIRRELREALGTVRLMYRSLQRQQRYRERKWL